jgi:DNA-binding response OmpR family regulator
MNRHGIPANADSTSAHTSQGPSARQQNTQRILVVEDDPTLAALEVEVLTAHGYTVVTVHSGELAITTLRHLIPDLVVLDLELTGNINGWEVFQELRTIADIPVLITSSSVTAVRTYMRDSGETRCTLDHLPKPYPMQTLLKRVKRMLPMTS